jgi:hypothetical protein
LHARHRARLLFEPLLLDDDDVSLRFFISALSWLLK